MEVCSFSVKACLLEDDEKEEQEQQLELEEMEGGREGRRETDGKNYC